MMVRLSVTGAAAALALLTASAARAQQPNAAQIFTPVQGDLALVNLRKLLGCVVDGVLTSAACADDRPLTAALGVFNVACLVVATVLACYLIYSLVADTANDGEAFGRGTNTRYTLLRVMAGAVLALPVKSGLSLVQILVVQIAVWGSGFGDTLWTKVAATQLNGMYGTLAPPRPRDGDYVLRGKLAKAMEARLYGYVCAKALMEYARNVSGNDNAAAIQPKVTEETALFGLSNVRTISYHFQDNNGYFRKASNICGGVNYEYVKITPKVAEKDEDASRALLDLAQQQSQQMFQAAITGLDGEASAIANDIVAGTRDDGAIQARIKAALDAAYNSANQSISESSNSQLQTAFQTYLANASADGWLSAALWQRAMTAAQARLLVASGGATANIKPVLPADINRYIPFFGHSDSAYLALADKAQRDLTYVTGFGGYFQAQGMGAVSPVTTDSAMKQSSELDLLSRGIAWIYSGVLGQISTDSTSAWKDPILEIQEVGQTISYYGMGSASAGAVAALFDDKTAEKLSGFAFFITAILFAAAFLLVGVVPFVIVVHFILATFNWFLVIAEAMVAVPVWLLTKFMPARSDGFVGNSGYGYLFFLGILLRPALIVIALLLSLLLMRVGLDVTNLFFRGALGMLSPDGAITSAMMGAAGLLAYASVVLIIVLTAAGQISALPETVLSWLGAQIARTTAKGAATSVAGAMLPTTLGRLGQSGTARVVGQIGTGARAGIGTTVQKLRGLQPPKST